LVSWCWSIISDEELDHRFKAVLSYPGLRFFKKEISGVSQWTGSEHKEMQKVFVSIMAGAVRDEELTVIRSLVDFIYYAQFQQHTSKTLAMLQLAMIPQGFPYLQRCLDQARNSRTLQHTKVSKYPTLCCKYHGAGECRWL
jgi:hypothetical protein